MNKKCKYGPEIKLHSDLLAIRTRTLHVQFIQSSNDLSCDDEQNDLVIICSKAYWGVRFN